MTIRLAIAQVAPKKADYKRNCARVGELFEQLADEPNPADLLVLPETALTGYFLEGGVREVARPAETVFNDLLAIYRASPLAATGHHLDILIGFYELEAGRYYNSALYAVLGPSNSGECRLIHVHRKFFLPTYGVFDEKRFVSRGRTISAYTTRFGPAATLICEDIWHSLTTVITALKGAQILFVPSASPGREFSETTIGNIAHYDRLLPNIATEHNIFVVYAGLVGFEGGKGFTGSSQVIDPFGKVLIRGPIMDECLVRADVDLDDLAVARAASPMLADLEAVIGDLLLEQNRTVRRPPDNGLPHEK